MDNYVLPDYFFEKAALKVGISKEDVATIYNRYIMNISKATEKEGNVYMTGLGTLTAQPKALSLMWKSLKILDHHYEKTGMLQDPDYERYFFEIDKIWQKMKKVQKKYEYIKGSLEKFRSNLGRFEEFFDNNGHYKGGSKKKKVNL